MSGKGSIGSNTKTNTNHKNHNVSAVSSTRHNSSSAGGGSGGNQQVSFNSSVHGNVTNSQGDSQNFGNLTQQNTANLNGLTGHSASQKKNISTAVTKLSHNGYAIEPGSVTDTGTGAHGAISMDAHKGGGSGGFSIGGLLGPPGGSMSFGNGGGNSPNGTPAIPFGGYGNAFGFGSQVNGTSSTQNLRFGNDGSVNNSTNTNTNTAINPQVKLPPPATEPLT